MGLNLYRKGVITMTESEKKHLHELHEKHYGKKKIAKEKAKMEDAMKHHSKGPTRNDLMLQAKVKGIKYFRILSKDELKEILDGAQQERIDQITKAAEERWKAGWGTRKKVESKT
jgi:hypothetical protein